MYALIERESEARELIEGVWNAGYVMSAVGSGDSGDISSPLGTLRFAKKDGKIQLLVKGKEIMVSSAERVADFLNRQVFADAGVNWLGHANPNYIKLRGPVVEEVEELLEYARVAMRKSDWGAAVEYLRDSALKFRGAGEKKLAARFMAQARRLAKKHGLKMPTGKEPELADLSGPVVEHEDDELVEAKPVGKVQQAVFNMLSSGAWVSVTDLARQLPPSIHFARIQSAADAMVKKGLLKGKNDPRMGRMVMLAEGLEEAFGGSKLKPVKKTATVKKISYSTMGGFEFHLPMHKAFYDDELRDYIATVSFDTDFDKIYKAFTRSGYSEDEVESVLADARRADRFRGIKLPKPIKVPVTIMKWSR